LGEVHNCAPLPTWHTRRDEPSRPRAYRTQAIADVVGAYAVPLGIDVAPHDCRRTFAKLALKGGARLDQIQLSLGHASIRTTERYLGVEQDLTDAPCDRLGLRLW
jgi:integrase